MVVAAVLGLGLGMAGGVMLGGQLFKLAEPKDYEFLDHVADHNENVPEPPTKLAVAPDVRGMLPYMPEWTTWPDFEQVRWLNSAIEWLWPSMSRAIKKMVDQMVGPILADLVRDQPLLDALTIDVFDLGPHAPALGGVKVYDTRDDEVIIETPLLFGSAIKLHVSARVRVGPVSIYIPLKVEDITLKATARVTIRPLVETLPCLGAISISLTSSPYIDLVLKAINDWDLMALPFLHDTVILAVRKITEGICVYPNTIPIPLMPNSGLPKPPVGMLEVDIHKIEGLRGSGDFFGKGDPYVRLSVIQLNPKDGTILKQGPYHQTKVQSGKKPVFNESKRLLLDELGAGHEVLIEVFDWDLLAAPDLMCEYHLLLDDSAHSQFSFIKSPLNPEEAVVHLQPPAPKTGLLSISNVSRMMSLSAAPKAGTSMGQLFLTLNYVPFFRPDDQVEDADNPAAALEAQQARAAPRKVNNDLKGVLTVNLTRCTDLPIVGGSCDSYVELKLADPDSAAAEPDTRKTELVMNETSPRFRQKFDFVYISATSVLTVTVYDKPGMLEVSSILKPFTKDDKVLGKVRIPVKDVVKAQRLKDAFPLQEAEQGDVHMTLEWQTVERDN